MENRRTYLLIFIVFVFSMFIAFSLTVTEDHIIKKNQKTNYVNVYVNLSSNNIKEFLSIAKSSNIDKIQYRTHKQESKDGIFIDKVDVYEKIFNKNMKNNFIKNFDKVVKYNYYDLDKLNFNKIYNSFIVNGSSSNIDDFFNKLDSKGFIFEKQNNNSYLSLGFLLYSNVYLLLAIIFMTIAITYINISLSSFDKALMTLNGYSKFNISKYYLKSFFKVVCYSSFFYLFIIFIFLKIYSDFYLTKTFLINYFKIYFLLIFVVSIFVFLSLNLHHTKNIVYVLKKKISGTKSSFILISIQRSIVILMLITLISNSINSFSLFKRYEKILLNNSKSNYFHIAENGNIIPSPEEQRVNMDYISNIVKEKSIIFRNSGSYLYFVNNNALKKLGISNHNHDVYFLNADVSDEYVLNLLNDFVSIQKDVFKTKQKNFDNINSVKINKDYLDVSSIIVSDETHSMYYDKLNKAILINLDQLDFKSRVNLIALGDYFFDEDLLNSTTISKINSNTNNIILSILPISGTIYSEISFLNESIIRMLILIFCLFVIEFSILVIIYDYFYNENREILAIKFLSGHTNYGFFKYFIYNFFIFLFIFLFFNVFKRISFGVSFFVVLSILLFEITVYFLYMNKVKKSVLTLLKGDDI